MSGCIEDSRVYNNFSLHFGLNLNVYSEEAANKSMVYSYHHGFSGFAAKLSPADAKKLKGFIHISLSLVHEFYYI